jgi:hypothetical protein
MEELPRLNAFTLAQEPRCGERARRLLDGAKGKAVTASTRWRLGQRVREDAALAHAEHRRPHRRDFPTPNELTSEECAVYSAAAAGYVLLFGEVAASTIDVPGVVTLPELGIDFGGRPGLFVDTDDGMELRLLRIAGTEPHIADYQVYAAALLTPGDRLPIRAIAADLLSLQTATTAITADHAAAAREWCDTRVHAWRDAADAGGFDHRDCLYCTFVWDCRVHKRGR